MKMDTCKLINVTFKPSVNVSNVNTLNNKITPRNYN